MITAEAKPHYLPETSMNAVVALKNAQAIVARTSFEKDLLTKYWGIPIEKIHVIGNGVNIQPFRMGNGRVFREKYNIPENVPIILSNLPPPVKALLNLAE